MKSVNLRFSLHGATKSHIWINSTKGFENVRIHGTIAIFSNMSGKVVIKLGGGLITDKGSMKTINTEAVRSVAKYVAEITDLGFAVLLVHGAG